jgi:hypothetical protein
LWITQRIALDAYFAFNEGIGYSPEEKELARDTLYHDIPHHFRWDHGTRRWESRKQKLPTLAVMHWNQHKPVIGRMYNCSPRDIERFSLRCLLISRKGCTSFEDLRTVPGMPEQGIEPVVVPPSTLLPNSWASFRMSKSGTCV